MGKYDYFWNMMLWLTLAMALMAAIDQEGAIALGCLFGTFLCHLRLNAHKWVWEKPEGTGMIQDILPWDVEGKTITGETYTVSKHQPIVSPKEHE